MNYSDVLQQPSSHLLQIRKMYNELFDFINDPTYDDNEFIQDSLGEVIKPLNVYMNSDWLDKKKILKLVRNVSKKLIDNLIININEYRDQKSNDDTIRFLKYYAVSPQILENILKEYCTISHKISFVETIKEIALRVNIRPHKVFTILQFFENVVIKKRSYRLVRKFYDRNMIEEAMRYNIFLSSKDWSIVLYGNPCYSNYIKILMSSLDIRRSILILDQQLDILIGNEFRQGNTSLPKDYRKYIDIMIDSFEAIFEDFDENKIKWLDINDLLINLSNAMISYIKLI